jgi:hypothetical protein
MSREQLKIFKRLDIPNYNPDFKIKDLPSGGRAEGMWRT